MTQNSNNTDTHRIKMVIKFDSILDNFQLSKNIEKSMINYDNQLHNSTLYIDRYKIIIDNSFTTRILGSAIFD